MSGTAENPRCFYAKEGAEKREVTTMVLPCLVQRLVFLFGPAKLCRFSIPLQHCGWRNPCPAIQKPVQPASKILFPRLALNAGNRVALLIQDQRCRNNLPHVVPLQQFATAAQPHLQRKMLPVNVWLNLRASLAFVDRDREELDLAISILAAQSGQQRQLLPAGPAPRCPEVHNHDLPSQRGKLLHVAGEVAQLKIVNSPAVGKARLRKQKRKDEKDRQRQSHGSNQKNHLNGNGQQSDEYQVVSLCAPAPNLLHPKGGPRPPSYERRQQPPSFVWFIDSSKPMAAIPAPDASPQGH